MIGEALLLLKDTVNEHLSTSSGWTATESEQVVFLTSEKLELIDFKLGSVSILLVNIEEDHSVRPADPRRRTLSDGTTQRVQPSIHLNVYVLFVARFSEYKQSLRYLSLIVQLFVTRRFLDHENTPALSDRIEKLVIELVTLPLAEQNNLWSLLRTAYQPSLLYKVRMVVFQDEEGVAAPPVVDPTVELGS